MPQAVVAQIRARSGIVGAVGLHAIGDIVVARGSGGHGHRAFVIILVIVIAGRVIAGPAIIAIATGGEGAANDGTGDRAGNEAATATTPPRR